MTTLVEALQQALGPAYRIDRELGGGGMSRVFVAEEPAARLQHPHIVPLLPAERAGVRPHPAPAAATPPRNFGSPGSRRIPVSGQARRRPVPAGG